MKQVLQDARSGEIAVTDVPAPQLLPGCVLVRIAASLVSAGTERASSEFATKNLAQKAQARPDLVREVMNKVRRDGLSATVQAVRTRLDQPTALGYSSAGTVLAVGEGVTDIAVGDRVACAGAGYAVHAEVACIPRLLCAKLPEGAETSLEEAAFSTVGSVALHGIRVAEVKLGEVVGVIGLGLLGQLTVQMLTAAGCRVVGMDIAADRAALAKQLGALDATTSAPEFHELCLQHTAGFGADAVLITAETPSSDPVNLAGQVARDRAVVVAVGTVGMELQRRTYYEKELDFRISRSYGPGRYDAAYEQKGRDYPIGYVRWTETRNMLGFLQLLADGKVDVKPLISHRFPVEDAGRAYEIITGKAREPFLGVLFVYPDRPEIDRRVGLKSAPVAAERASSLAVGILGAGGFAVSTLLPAMKRVSGIEFVGCCSATGAHSRTAADKFSFRYCTTDENEVLKDPAINTVVIATRHHLHAQQTLAALAAGKHVFCEKPLCLSEEELAEIVRGYERAGSRQGVLVGFNRRFAPMAVVMREFLRQVHEPLAMHYRVNAGFLPADHWLNDPELGGGRLNGEICHFIDFLSFLCEAIPVEVQTQDFANPGQYSGDNLLLTVRFANGSHGTISYLANGDRSYSKERVEVFGGGSVAVLEDFRYLETVRQGRKSVKRARLKQDKGHQGEWEAFVRAIRSGVTAPIPFEEIVATTLATLRAVKSRASGKSEKIDVVGFINAASEQKTSGV